MTEYVINNQNAEVIGPQLIDEIQAIIDDGREARVCRHQEK